MNYKSKNLIQKFVALLLIQAFLCGDCALIKEQPSVARAREGISTLAPGLNINIKEFQNIYLQLSAREKDQDKQNKDSIPAFKSLNQKSAVFFNFFGGFGLFSAGIFKAFTSESLFDALFVGGGLILISFLYKKIKDSLQNRKNSLLLSKLLLPKHATVFSESLLKAKISEEELRESVRQIRQVWHGKEHEIIEKKIMPKVHSLNLEARKIEILRRNIDRILDNAVNAVADMEDYPRNGLVQVIVKGIIDKGTNKRYLMVEVKDNGIGIEKSTLRKIFKKQTTPGKGRKEYGRLLLGSYTKALYWTAREIVKELGGFIRIETVNNGKRNVLNYLGLKPEIVEETNVEQKQHGTIFQLYIPLGKAVDFKRREFLSTFNPIKLIGVTLALGMGVSTCATLFKYFRNHQADIELKWKMSDDLSKLTTDIEIIEKYYPEKLEEMYEQIRQYYPGLSKNMPIIDWPKLAKYWAVRQELEDKEAAKAAEIYKESVEVVLKRYNQVYPGKFIYNYQLLKVICAYINGEQWKELLEKFITENKDRPKKSKPKKDKPSEEYKPKEFFPPPVIVKTCQNLTNLSLAVVIGTIDNSKIKPIGPAEKVQPVLKDKTQLFEENNRQRKKDSRLKNLKELVDISSEGRILSQLMVAQGLVEQAI